MLEFEKITARNALDIMRLSKTLSKAERKNVADNSVSIAQGSLSECSWMRAIILKNEKVETNIGFVMLHIGSNFDDGIDVDGPYLWRLMIAKPYQRKGYGTEILDKLVKMLNKEGYHFLETSVERGEASPYDFYRNYGFVESGNRFGDELGLIFKW